VRGTGCALTETKQIIYKNYKSNFLELRNTQMKKELMKNILACILGISMCILTSGCTKKDKPAPLKPPFKFVTATNLFGVDCVDAENIYIVGFNSSILHSADSGNTWQFQKSGTTLNLCEVSFVSPEKGWISGRKGTMLYTEDSGATWVKQQTLTDKHLFSLCFVNDTTGWAVGDFGTIINTTDGGNTWTNQSMGEDRIYNDVHFIDENNGWIAGEYGLIYHTADGGNTWTKQECRDIIPVYDETEWASYPPSLYSVYFLDKNRGWISGMDGILITTMDGGKTWTKVANPAEAGEVTLFSVQFEGQTGWAVGQKGTFVMTTDGGSTWQDKSELTNTKFWLRAMNFCKNGTGIAVGSRGTILKSTDFGKNWTMLSGIPLVMNKK